MPWIIIQRVTLPLSVFFHFHAAVVYSQLIKEVYSVRDDGTHQGPREIALKILRSLSHAGMSPPGPRRGLGASQTGSGPVKHQIKYKVLYPEWPFNDIIPNLTFLT